MSEQGQIAAAGEWAPEHVVDEHLARLLLADQFPQVPVDSLELFGQGWDNTVWLAGGVVFRFPRRGVVVPGVERQVALLPRIAPLLPAPIPRPLYVGQPRGGYPFPFYGAPLLPGREPAQADPDDDVRAGIARPLGAFLRALHDLDPDALDSGGVLVTDPTRRADMPFRVGFTRKRLADLERMGVWRPPPSLAALLDEAVELPASEARCLAHGDLHLRHILVGDPGGLAGVIDWDDICRADPAIDLVLLWAFLPPPARAAFLEAYGAIDRAAEVRSRVLAVFLAATLVLYGRDQGMPAIEREALASLERAVS